MPEGHTIHGLARVHAAALAGRPVAVSSPQGRFAAGAALVDGLVLERTDAHGKHLFYEFPCQRILHVHLGLYGAFTAHPVPPPEPRPTTRMRLVGEGDAFDLVGAITCEVLTAAERDAVVAALGPDPIRRDADPERAWRALQRRRGPIGVALLDQAVFAGVGNVYRAEALHVHGISPERPANEVTREEFDAIWATLVRWLRRAVKDQVIITVEPKVLGKARSKIVKGEAVHVYRREECFTCGTPVRRWDLSGRWAYACPTCQPA